MAVDYKEFASMIKEGNPDLVEMDDIKAVKLFISEHPEYEKVVTMPKGFLEDTLAPRGQVVPPQPLYEKSTPEKVSAGKLGEKLSPEQAQKISSVRNVSSQALQSGVNTALMGLPKAVLAKLGYTLPEAETTGEKVGSVVGSVAGMAASPAAKIAGTVGTKVGAKALPVLGKVGAKALGAGTGAAAGISAQGLSEDVLAGKSKEEVGKNVAKNAILGLSVGAGASLTTDAALGIGGYIRKNFGGISDATLKVIKKMGAKFVFDKEKSNVDYLAKNIVPEAQKRISKSVLAGGDNSYKALTKIGANKDEALAIAKMTPKNRKFISKLIDATDDTPVVTEIDNNLKRAGAMFRKTLKDAPKDTMIDIKPTFKVLQNKLKGMELIDFNGNVLAKKGVAQENKLVELYKNLQEKTVASKGLVNKDSYNRMLNMMEAFEPTNPKYTKIVYAAERNFRNDATKAIPRLKNARNIYTEAKALDNVAKSLQKLKGEGSKSFGELLQTKINALKSPEKYQTRKEWSNLLGTKIMDNIDAHMANIDYGLTANLPGAGGGQFASRSGILKSVISETSKGYEKFGRSAISKLPKTEKATTIASKLLKKDN